MITARTHDRLIKAVSFWYRSMSLSSAILYCWYRSFRQTPKHSTAKIELSNNNNKITIHRSTVCYNPHLHNVTTLIAIM